MWNGRDERGKKKNDAEMLFGAKQLRERIKFQVMLCLHV